MVGFAPYALEPRVRGRTRPLAARPMHGALQALRGCAMRVEVCGSEPRHRWAPLSPCPTVQQLLQAQLAGEFPSWVTLLPQRVQSLLLGVVRAARALRECWRLRCARPRAAEDAFSTCFSPALRIYSFFFFSFHFCVHLFEGQRHKARASSHPPVYPPNDRSSSIRASHQGGRDLMTKASLVAPLGSVLPGN